MNLKATKPGVVVPTMRSAASFVEAHGRILTAIPHVVRDTKFRVCINRRPGPNVAPSVRLLLWRDVLFLRHNKCPNFIALQTANPQPSHVAVMIIGASTYDVKASLVFQLALDRRSLNLCVIDPSNAVRDRWRAICPNARFWEFDSIEQFLAVNPPWWRDKGYLVNSCPAALRQPCMRAPHRRGLQSN